MTAILLSLQLLDSRFLLKFEHNFVKRKKIYYKSTKFNKYITVHYLQKAETKT